LIDFSDKKTGFEGLVVVRVSRSSSKFGGGGDKCDAKNSIAFCVPPYATFVSKDSHLTHRTSASEEGTDPCRWIAVQETASTWIEGRTLPLLHLPVHGTAYSIEAS